MNPAIEWLSARLAQGPATPREVMDEAKVLGITPTELLDAKSRLKVTTEARTPAAGGKAYNVWVMPVRKANQFQPGDDPRRYVTPRKEEALAPTEKRATRDPKLAVQKAKDRLARKSMRYVRGIEELTTRIDKDPTACPTCGRGTKRSEEVRLRALTAALDRAGVVAPRAGDHGDEAPTGPLIVFPAGTRIAILAEPSVNAQHEAVPTLRRADEGYAG